MYLDRNARLQEEANMVEKWSWLTEGIENKDDVINTSIVLQNSYESMIQEGQLQEGWLESLLNEEEINEAPNLSTNVGTNVIPKVLFPVIRRVMPSLIANQLVSVQPIAARTGVIYNIAYNFTDTKGNITAGDEYAGTGQTSQQGPGYSTWYSSEKIGPFTATIAADTDDVDTIVDCGVAISSFLGTSATGFTVKRIDVYNAVTGAKFTTVLDQADVVEGAPTFTGVGNVGYNVTTGDVILKSTTTAIDTPNPGVPWIATDEIITYLTYDQEASDKIPEMEFSIQSQTVDTTERKLKIRWTKEAEQDMKAYHKIDVESELVKVASMEMNYEIDRELLKAIGDVVVDDLNKVHKWDDDAIGDGAGAGGNNTSGNYLDRHRALSQKISMLAAKVAQYNRQGGANWAVVSPQVAATLQMLPNFKGEIAGSQMNVSQAGVLNGNIKVYVDPNKSGADSNEILMGFKSTSSTYGAGIVYSPYTNWMSNTVTHPDNFNSIRGFFSRYAVTKVVRGEYFYSKLSITGLELA